MKIVVEKNEADFDRTAAEMMRQELSGGGTVLLPTGKTAVGMYQRLVQNRQLLAWNKIKIFMLDVNYPQDPAEADSFLSYIKTNLLDQINLPQENFNILDSQTDDPEKECQEYEAKIAGAGGLDLTVLGIGENGHIAYNEPGSSFHSLTRKVRLASGRRQYGLTVGIKTIMSARKITLLAKGRNKARAIKKAIEGPVNLDCPASVLQNHLNITYLIDHDAAGLLSNH